MDYLYLQKDSTLKFLGLARSLGFTGEVKPFDSIFELVNPHVDESKSSGKHVSGGDIVCITPSDRKFISAAPTSSSSAADKIFFTAADQ